MSLVDSNWSSVVLGLDCDGADAATSLTDLSNSKHTLTFNGDAQLDQAQYKYGNASILFDGTGDYVSIPDSTDFQFGASEDFTVEFWLRLNADPGVGTSMAFVNRYNPAGNNRSWAVNVYNDAGTVKLYFNVSTNGTTNTAAGGSWTHSTGTWYHIAAVRASGVITIYADGTAVGSTGSESGALYVGTNTVRIGAFGDTTGILNGWMDDIRITKGVARYTTSFTPPTKSLFISDNNWNSNVLLLRFDGSDTATSTTDYSNSAHTVTFNGDAQLDTAQYKYGVSSCLLDGTGDYLSIADSDDWHFGTGDFTVELWARWNTLPTDGNQQFLVCQYETGTDNRAWFFVLTNTAGTYSLRYVNYTAGTSGSVVTNKQETWTTPSTGTWYHLVLERSGGNTSIYVGGTELGSATSDSANIYNSAAALTIGCAVPSSPANFMNGWIDSIRITKGVARYQAAFTAPTQAFPVKDQDFRNVVLALPMYGPDAATLLQDISDSAHTVTANGNAQLDTAQSKYGGVSCLFDGTGDYLSVPDSADWSFGSGDFTVECWVRWNTLPTSPNAQVLVSQWEGASNQKAWQLYINNISGTYSVLFLASSDGSTNDIYMTRTWAGAATGTWFHMAVVRNSGTTQIYVNGVALGASASDLNTYHNSSVSVLIGANTPATPGAFLNGWIDDVRITKGTAKYTAAFVPPPRLLGDFYVGIYEEIISESLDGDDTSSGKKITYPSISDTATLALAITDAMGRSIVEGITALDFLGIPGILAEGISLADTSFAPIIWHITEALSATDSITDQQASRILESLVLAGNSTSNVKLYNAIAESINVLDIFTVVFQALVSESVIFTDTSTPLPKKYKTLAEALVLTTNDSNNVAYYNTILAAIAAADTVSRGFALSTSESLAIVEILTSLLKGKGTVSESTSLTDSSSRFVRLYAISSEDLELTTSTTINSVLNAINIEDLILGLSFDDGTETYTGWVINPENYAVSEYDNWNFNSLSKLNEEYFATNSNGLYKITGNMDESDYIKTRMTLAALDFGTSNLKQIPYIYVGTSNNGTLVLKVSVDGQETVYYVSQTDQPYLDTEAIKLGRGLVGRYWQFSLSTNDSTIFDLDTIEFYPVQLGRKRR